METNKKDEFKEQFNQFYQDLDSIRKNYRNGFYRDILSLYQLRYELTEKYGSLIYQLILMKHPLYVLFIRQFEFALTEYLGKKMEGLDWRVRQSGPAEYHWKQKRYTHILMKDGFGNEMLDNHIQDLLVSKQTILNEQDKYPALEHVLWEFENIWMGQIKFTSYIQ